MKVVMDKTIADNGSSLCLMLKTVQNALECYENAERGLKVMATYATIVYIKY
jgi:hypothetical protein